MEVLLANNRADPAANNALKKFVELMDGKPDSRERRREDRLI